MLHLDKPVRGAAIALKTKNHTELLNTYDLAGKRVGIGDPGSIFINKAELLFKAAGVWDDVTKIVGAEPDESLRDGLIDVMVRGVAFGNGLAPDTAQVAVLTGRLRMVDMGADLIRQVGIDNPIWADLDGVTPVTGGLAGM